MSEVQSNKRPLFSRIKGIWRNRIDEDMEKDIDELDNSHRSSRHTVNLDEISSTASKITSQDFLDTSSERKSHNENGGNDDIISPPIRIEEDEVLVAEPYGTVCTQESLVEPRIPQSGRHVHFSTVRVREFPISMGDNPGSSRGGVPITIGWETMEENIYNVDVFQCRAKACNLHQFRMAPVDRVLMLKRQGYSGQEIREGTSQVDQFRKQRRRTIRTLHFSGLHEFLERLQRSIANATIHKSRKRKEREFLRQYKSKSPSTSFEAARSTFRAPAKLKDSIVISGGKNVYLD
ncbi:unnamed protein product [Cylindrotheca closterium]|uniref:Uncharacterized protein n=1 Tax=Cylindrotheca closterium TaxID=2856 RepID=A0AAD2FUV2_9STRA|nr:unnamed protein product [Cylindrotheca closterium]